MRLAEHVAGTLDVDAMLDAMTPEQFMEWQAKDLVEPIGHSGTHEILSMIGALLAAFCGAKDLDQYAFQWWKQRPEQAGDSTEAAIAALEAIGAKRS